jgi:hypothetical protein
MSPCAPAGHAEGLRRFRSVCTALPGVGLTARTGGPTTHSTSKYANSLARDEPSGGRLPAQSGAFLVKFPDPYFFDQKLVR